MILWNNELYKEHKKQIPTQVTDRFESVNWSESFEENMNELEN